MPNRFATCRNAAALLTRQGFSILLEVPEEAPNANIRTVLFNVLAVPKFAKDDQVVALV